MYWRNCDSIYFWLLLLLASLDNTIGQGGCDCGEKSIVLEGENNTQILSPQYPDKFPATCACRWRIETPVDGFGMKVEVDMDTVPQVDFVEISTVFTRQKDKENTAQPLKNCTGSGNCGGAIAAFGKVVLINFRAGSDRPSISQRKFNITVTSVIVFPYNPPPLHMYGGLTVGALVLFLLLLFIVPYLFRRKLRKQKVGQEKQQTPTEAFSENNSNLATVERKI